MNDLHPALAHRIAALLSASHLLVVALDTEGKVTYANDRLLALVGFEAAEVLGKPWSGTFVPTTESDVFTSAPPSGTRHMGPLETRSGQERCVSWTTVPQDDETKIGTLSLGVDVTDQRDLVSNLRRQKDALDEHAIVAITNRQGEITYANDKFCEISGYSREELLGRDHRIVNSGHHPASFFKELWATIGRGESWHGEVCNCTKDGRLYWVNTTIVPFRDAAGNIDRYVAIRGEITKRKEHEQTLSQLASIVGSTDDAVVREDEGGSITSWNPAAERIYGYTPAEAVGQPVDLLVCPEQREVELANRGRRAAFEAIHRTKNGDEIDVSVTISPIHGNSGDIVGWARVSRDITEHKAMQERLTQASKLAALGELAGNVAHEVNNPIGIIGGKARLLLTGSETLPPKVRRELQKIVEQSDRVGRLTRGLLDYCRPSIGLKQPMDLHQPLFKALSFVESKANRYNVDVERDLAECLPEVNASDNEMEQVFLNLFLNAIDAMPRGGTLTVRSDVIEGALPNSQRAVRVVVSDSGEGIDPELHERIFEPFFTTKVGKGTGLGLAICYGLVRSHEGAILLDPAPTEGATFSVLLPALERELPQNEDPTDTRRR